MSTPKNKRRVSVQPENLGTAQFEEVPEQVLQEAAAFIVAQDYDQFNLELIGARVCWRKYRQLVECPEYPEPFRAAYVEHNGKEPEDSIAPNDEILRPDYCQQIIPKVIRTARVWHIRRQEGEASVNKFLANESKPKE